MWSMIKRNIRWFSLLEVMIAISVFSIWILAILQILLKNLSVADTTQLKTTAILLAKEWIELSYNIRDTNLIKWLARDCVLDNGVYSRYSKTPWNESLYSDKNICKYFFGSWLDFGFSFDKDNYIYSYADDNLDSFDDRFEQWQLFYKTGIVGWYQIGQYSNKKIEESMPTYFARYITFTKIKEWEHVLPQDKILKVSSHTLIKKWVFTWEIVLESFIWNY